MDSKFSAVVVIVLLAVLALFAVSVGNSDSSAIDGEIMSFNVSSGPSELLNVIDTIKTVPYYDGYSLDTVKWMESLGNKQVFSSNDSIVIMDVNEAQKIPTPPDITDVWIYDYFDAMIVENHDLGGNLPEVYYVKNVNFTNQEVVGNGLA